MSAQSANKESPLDEVLNVIEPHASVVKLGLALFAFLFVGFAVLFSGNASAISLVSSDIGNPAPTAGSTTFLSTGNYDLYGDGYDIWGTSDSFRYAYQNAPSGDYEFISRVDFLQYRDVWSKAGIMVRASTAPNSRYLYIFTTPQSNGVNFQGRMADGAWSAQYNNISPPGYPVWFKMKKQGNNYSVYMSSDGVSFSQVGSTVAINLGTAPSIGLAVTSHVQGTLALAKFRNTALNIVTAPTPTPIPTPSPILTPDLVIQSGSPSYSPAGPAVGNVMNFSTIVRNQGLGSTGSGYNLQICVDNPNCLNSTSGSVGYWSMPQLAAGASSAQVTTSSWSATAGGHTVYACADYNKNVSESNESNNCASMAFSVATAPSPTPVPLSSPSPTPTVPNDSISPWTPQDIGNPTPGGQSKISEGNYDLYGDGYDIYWDRDSFRYANQQKSGNFEISGQVASLENKDPWSKAGLMIRATNAQDSPYVFFMTTPTNGTRLQYRTTAGAWPSDVNIGSGHKDFKIVKIGNNYKFFAFVNGSSYSQVASLDINLGTSPYAGMAVTSHRQGILARAEFRNIALKTILPPSVDIFRYDPTSLQVYKGGAAAFVWLASNADYCEATSDPLFNTWNGRKDTTGGVVLSPIVDQTIIDLRCYGTPGTTSAYRYAIINVLPVCNGNDANAPIKNGQMYQASGDPAIYVAENCQKRHIASMDVFNLCQYDSAAVKAVAKGYLNALANGPEVTSTSGCPTAPELPQCSGTLFLQVIPESVEKGKNIELSAGGLSNCSSSDVIKFDSTTGGGTWDKPLVNCNLGLAGNGQWGCSASFTADWPAGGPYSTRALLDRGGNGSIEAMSNVVNVTVTAPAFQPGPSLEAICPAQCTKEMIRAYVNNVVPEPYRSTIHLMLDRESDGGDWGALANDGWNCPVNDPCHGVVQFKIGTWRSAQGYSGGTWTAGDVYPDFVSVWDLRGAYPDENVWNPFGQINIAYQYLRNCWYTHWPWLPRPSYCAASGVPF